MKKLQRSCWKSRCWRELLNCDDGRLLRLPGARTQNNLNIYIFIYPIWWWHTLGTYSTIYWWMALAWAVIAIKSALTICGIYAVYIGNLLFTNYFWRWLNAEIINAITPYVNRENVDYVEIIADKHTHTHTKLARDRRRFFLYRRVWFCDGEMCRFANIWDATRGGRIKELLYSKRVVCAAIEVKRETDGWDVGSPAVESVDLQERLPRVFVVRGEWVWDGVRVLSARVSLQRLHRYVWWRPIDCAANNGFVCAESRLRKWS